MNTNEDGINFFVLLFLMEHYWSISTLFSADHRFNDMEFRGTLFVNTRHDDDFIGFMFGYQDHGTFYLVSWKQRAQVFWDGKPFRASATSALQIKVSYIPILSNFENKSMDFFFLFKALGWASFRQASSQISKQVQILWALTKY